MPAETIAQFLTRITHPLIEHAGFVFYGITDDSDMVGVQFIRVGEQEPLTLWLSQQNVLSAMGSYGPRALVQHIEEKIAKLQAEPSRPRIAE